MRALRATVQTGVLVGPAVTEIEVRTAGEKLDPDLMMKKTKSHQKVHENPEYF